MSNAPPPGAIASKEDFKHTRNDDGELQGVWQPIPGTQSVCENCEGKGTIITDDGLEEGDYSPEGCSECGGTGNIKKHVKIRPITQGDANEYLPQGGSLDRMGDEDIVRLFNRFVITPDFGLNPRDAESELQDFTAFGVEPLVMAIYKASGFDMVTGTVQDNAELAELAQQIEGNTKNGSSKPE